MRIVWITGSPGVGKSTAAWKLYTRLPEPVSHVDIDQLGMLAPAPADDPARETLKLEALRRLAQVHERSGSRLLIVSGVSAPRSLFPTVVLRADETAIRERLLGRGAGADYIRSAVADAARAPDPRADGTVAIDTTDRGVDEVATEIARMLPALHDPAPPLRPASDPPRLPRVVVVRSSRAVGASTVGFALFSRRAADGSPTAFLDPAQLRLLRGGTVPLGSAVTAVGSALVAAGATTLIVVGPLDAEERAEIARSASAVDVVRLTAPDDAIAERVRLRAAGGPLHLAGDDLRGLVGSRLERAVARAIADARDTHPLVGEAIVETGGRTPEQVAASVSRALGELAGKITDR